MICDTQTTACVSGITDVDELNEEYVGCTSDTHTYVLGFGALPVLPVSYDHAVLLRAVLRSGNSTSPKFISLKRCFLSGTDMPFYSMLAKGEGSARDGKRHRCSVLKP